MNRTLRTFAFALLLAGCPNEVIGAGHGLSPDELDCQFDWENGCLQEPSIRDLPECAPYAELWADEPAPYVVSPGGVR